MKQDKIILSGKLTELKKIWDDKDHLRSSYAEVFTRNDAFTEKEKQLKNEVKEILLDMGEMEFRANGVKAKITEVRKITLDNINAFFNDSPDFTPEDKFNIFSEIIHDPKLTITKNKLQKYLTKTAHIDAIVEKSKANKPEIRLNTKKV